MSNQIIRKLFNSRVQDFADANDYAAAFENKRFDPKTDAKDGRYLQTFLLPANTVSIDLAGAHRGYRGVYQIDIVSKKSVGTGASETIQDLLAALFPVNLALTDTDGLIVKVMTPLTAPVGRLGDRGYVISTSFQYRSENF